MAKTKGTKSVQKGTKVTKSDKKGSNPKKSKKATPKVNDCNKNDCKCQKQIANMKRLLKKTLGTSVKAGNTGVLRKLQYMASQNAKKGY